MKINELRNSTIAAGGIARLMSGLGPQIMFEAPNDQGSGQTDAEKAAAEKAAADKAAADKAAADKAAADKAAAERNDDGKTDDEKAELLKEVMEKKKKLKDAEAERARLETELKKFEGVDLDKIRALIDAEKAREEKELEAKGEFDRLKQRIAEERANEKKTFEEQIAALRADLEKKDTVIDGLTVGSDFANSKFITENLVLPPRKARTVYGAHFESVDGRTVAYDKPKGEAGRTMLIDAAGEPLPFDEALKRIVDQDPDKDNVLRSKASPGAQSKTSPGRPADKPVPGVTGASRIALALQKRAK